MSANPVKRKLAAILAADAVGYSRLMAADEEGTIRILAAHRAVIDGIIQFHEGRIVNTAGDSVLAEFASPVEAVRCAVEIQDALKTRNDSLPEEQRMQFRMGVNLGDVMVKGDDLLGDGVNVAARLEGIAEPGQICVSSSVYDQIAGKLDLGFVDIGPQSLKNIDRPVRAYRIEREGRKISGTRSLRRLHPATRAWAAGLLASALAALAVAWYLDLLPAPRREARPVVAVPAPDERAKVEAELAQARKEAEDATRRAETQAAAAAEAKRALEEGRAAEVRARAEAELARARADAEASRRKAAAELAAAEASRRSADADAARRAMEAEIAKATEARRTAEAAAKAAITAKLPQPAEAAPKPTPSAAPGAEPPRVAARTPAAALSRRYEGRWAATFTCAAFRDKGARSFRGQVAVADDAFVVQVGEIDQPGSSRMRGVPDEEGRLRLRGTGISILPQFYGKPFPVDFDGKFEGGRFEGAGKWGQRDCQLTISRAQ